MELLLGILGLLALAAVTVLAAIARIWARSEADMSPWRSEAVEEKSTDVSLSMSSQDFRETFLSIPD